MHRRCNTRREFLSQAGLAGAGLAATSLISDIHASEKAEKPKTLPKGKAEHCILIWLGGGSCHIDTWDPKRKGDPKQKKMLLSHRGMSQTKHTIGMCGFPTVCLLFGVNIRSPLSVSGQRLGARVGPQDYGLRIPSVGS